MSLRLRIARVLLRFGSLWLVLIALTAAANAAGEDFSQPVFAQAELPFGLPLAGEPGPNTWLVAQSYGNTTGAYFSRKTQYVRVQGIHFGIDFSAPCGTAVVAIGDGVVSGTDGPWGSAPHNLMIDHPNGYSSLYGHLLETPKVQRGQVVKKGQPVALSGDPDETCYSRPHLHLEIRSRSYLHFYNPVLLINADWDSLALTGSFSRGFEKDLDNPRRWQSFFDQPEVDVGGPLVNDFQRPWPPAQGTGR
jgi:murein DD-endopeptidase MepM/ murein hydrolase activator NlpD